VIGDSIRQVRQAEDEAEDVIEEAAEQVERLRSDARNDYSIRVMSATEKARRSAESLRTQVLREAAEEIGAINKSARWEREMLALDSSKKTDAALKRVLGMLREDWFH
jgi:vacuolar-type H+-ATPase subunit H